MRINGWVVGGVALALAVGVAFMFRTKKAAPGAPPVAAAPPPKPSKDQAVVGMVGGLLTTGLSIFKTGSDAGFW